MPELHLARCDAPGCTNAEALLRDVMGGCPYLRPDGWISASLGVFGQADERTTFCSWACVAAYAEGRAKGGWVMASDRAPCTLYSWSHVDGQIRGHAVRWLSSEQCWLEEFPNGWVRVPDGVWKETPAAAREAAREHFERERARVDEALTRLRPPAALEASDG